MTLHRSNQVREAVRFNDDWENVSNVAGIVSLMKLPSTEDCRVEMGSDNLATNTPLSSPHPHPTTPLVCVLTIIHAGLHGLVDLSLTRIPRDRDHDLREECALRLGRADMDERRQAVHDGHLEVHEDNAVGGMVFARLHALVRVVQVVEGFLAVVRHVAR